MRELQDIAEERGIALAQLVAQIDEERPREANLSSAIRLYVLERLKRKLASLQ